MKNKTHNIFRQTWQGYGVRPYPLSPCLLITIELSRRPWFCIVDVYWIRCPQKVCHSWTIICDFIKPPVVFYLAPYSQAHVWVISIMTTKLPFLVFVISAKDLMALIIKQDKPDLFESSFWNAHFFLFKGLKWNDNVNQNSVGFISW